MSPRATRCLALSVQVMPITGKWRHFSSFLAWVHCSRCGLTVFHLRYPHSLLGCGPAIRLSLSENTGHEWFPFPVSPEAVTLSHPLLVEMCEVCLPR